jgi:NIMA (never in mitosis gene a)-related kinase
MSIRDFQVGKKLGQGAYSTVYRARRVVDGQDYAFKQVSLGSLSEKEKANALNEVRILASIQHANVIGYKEAFLDEPSCTLK